MGDSVNALERHLRHAAGLPERATTDAALLARFARERDEAAFAELVRRYGPLVLSVCRRIAGPDADDAFQATFLILAKKAGELPNRPAIGGWLYEVAHRTALKARESALRRRIKEVAAARPEGGCVSEPSDTLAVVEQELQRLPRRYREPLILCVLCGRGRKEVAEQLGIAEGTLSSRLAKAREILAARLRRRGVTVPAIAFLAVCDAVGQATTTLALRAKTVAIATGTVPVAVGQIASEVTRAMVMNKLRVLVLLALGATACAVGLLTRAPASAPATEIVAPGAPVANEQPAVMQAKELQQKVADAKKDLTGVWELQKQSVDDKAVDARYEYYRYTFTERTLRIEFKHKGGDGTDVAGVVELNYTANPTTTPPQLNLFNKDALLMCIYDQNKDALKIARQGSSEVERPNGFALKAKRITDLPLTVWEFKRNLNAKPLAPNAGNGATTPDR